MKKLVILIFVIYITVFGIITISTEDLIVSEVENKILKQRPKISIRKVISGNFMSELETYASDQFPKRSEFIKIKNTIDLLLGNKEFRNIYICKDGRFIEKFQLNMKNIEKNIEAINNIIESKKNKIKNNINTNFIRFI